MPPTLYIIDAYAAFYRNYHAIRTPMTSPVTKEPTNMTFGFLGSLLKLLRGDGPAMQAWGGPPTYLAVATDVSDDRGTFRSQLYADYKANRAETPTDLVPQAQRCLAMLDDIGVPVLGAAGFEADDVFATLASQLRVTHPDLRIRMVSKDKDLKQLLAPDREDGAGGAIELFDVHTDVAFSRDTLAAETGLAPSQVIDMLALMGDSSDNVPGVEGVGEKTAAMLIKEYGSLDALLARAGDVKGKRGEKLREAASRLGLSRQLVTLRHDVPVSLDLDRARVRELQLGKLIPLCKELGFNRYQDEVRQVMTSLGMQPPEAAPSSIHAAATSASPARQLATSASANALPSKPASARKPSRSDDSAQGGLFDALGAAQATSPAPHAATITAQSGRYTCITARGDLNALITRCRAASVVSIDTETTSLSPRDAKLCGVSISIEPGEGFYIPTRSPTPDAHLATREVLDVLRPILEDPRIHKCGHNLKYDLLIFRAHGVRLALSQEPGNAEGSFDSMIASYLIDASRSSHSLDALALALLGRTNISITQLIGTGKDQRTFDTVSIDLATQYAAEDADVALQLRNAMLPQLRDMGLTSLFDDVEMPLLEVLAELEWNGILVDPSELDRQRERLQRKVEAILASIEHESRAALGRVFDPDSPKQLAAALFNKPEDEPAGLGIKGQKKTKTGYSTDAEVLENLAEDPAITTPIPRLILEYRQLTKLISTYLVALKDAIHPATGRIHSSFHQTVAATGRLASSDPNLQNIPIRTDEGREIRKAFLAPPGRMLVTADYSQIELRLLAHLSKDPALIDAFHNDADIHTAVAAQIHHVDPKDVTRDQRSGAKMVNFGIVYGITAFGLARRLKVPEREAAAIIDGYKRRFAGITTFLQECIEQAKARGYVETILGRRRPIPDAHSNVPMRRALAERLAINSVVQGSAADLIKLAMVKIHAQLNAPRREDRSEGHPPVPGQYTGRGHPPPPGEDTGGGSPLMLLQIHDELVFEVDAAHAQSLRELIVRHMEGAMRLLVPLKADAHIASNWFDGK